MWITYFRVDEIIIVVVDVAVVVLVVLRLHLNMHLHIAVDSEKPIPSSKDSDSGLWKMNNSLNQADSVPQLRGETLDNYANFYVVYSTISGFCNVPYNLKRTGLEFNDKLSCCDWQILHQHQ